MERGQNPNIIQGRMPVAVVHLARFGNTKALATKDMAAQFGTTVGKVDDIKKNRNFAYGSKQRSLPKLKSLKASNG